MKQYKIILEDSFENSSVDLQISLKIDIENISFIGEILGWSNDEQKYLPLEESNYKEFYEGDKFYKFQIYYKEFLDNYLNFLSTKIKTKTELKNFITILENPPIKYNQKLINSFGAKLDSLVRDYLDISPILDKTTMEFIPQLINGWYGDDIEVSCDMSDNKFAKIEDLSGDYKLLSVDEFFQKIKGK